MARDHTGGVRPAPEPGPVRHHTGAPGAPPPVRVLTPRGARCGAPHLGDGLLAETPAAETALVVAINRHVIELLHTNGQTERCRLHGRFRSEAHRGEGVVVGDRAVLGPAVPPPAPGMPPPLRTVLGITPRTSALRRHLTSRGEDDRVGEDLLVAANVDLCLIVQSFRAPVFRPTVADRLIALARACAIPAVLVLNKAEDAPPEAVASILAPYRRLGVDGFAVSALCGTGLQPLGDRAAGHLTVMLGPSGVGKSALAAALTPGSGPATGAISEARLRAGRGRHTTVQSRLYPLRGGGYIIDTAGIRSLALPDAASAADAFPEIAEVAPACRFSDCTHREEPGCAVRAAVAEGRLAQRAYAGYLLVVRDLAARPAGRGDSHPGARKRQRLEAGRQEGLWDGGGGSDPD